MILLSTVASAIIWIITSVIVPAIVTLAIASVTGLIVAPRGTLDSALDGYALGGAPSDALAGTILGLRQLSFEYFRRASSRVKIRAKP